MGLSRRPRPPSLQRSRRRQLVPQCRQLAAVQVCQLKVRLPHQRRQPRQVLLRRQQQPVLFQHQRRQLVLLQHRRRQPFQRQLHRQRQVLPRQPVLLQRQVHPVLQQRALLQRRPGKL